MPSRLPILRACLDAFLSQLSSSSSPISTQLWTSTSTRMSLVGVLLRAGEHESPIFPVVYKTTGAFLLADWLVRVMVGFSSCRILSRADKVAKSEIACSDDKGT